MGSDGMVAITPGQSLSLRFAKGFDKRASKLERASTSGAGPSIGIEVSLNCYNIPLINCRFGRNVKHP